MCRDLALLVTIELVKGVASSRHVVDSLGGSGRRNSCSALSHCLGAVGSATPAMHNPTAPSGTPAIHCRTAWGSAMCYSCNTPPHWLGKWAVELLHCTARLPGGSGQCKSCNALPHYLGAVGSARAHCPGAVGAETPAMQCLTAWGRLAVELLHHTASLPGVSGQ